MAYLAENNWNNLVLLEVKTDSILLDVVSALQVGDEESREQLIKTHYMARVGELTTQLQISDSKAVHFHSEVMPPPPTSYMCVYLSNCFFLQITDLFTPHCL